jgi:tetratricopeptide (TPR) repeat protein
MDIASRKCLLAWLGLGLVWTFCAFALIKFTRATESYLRCISNISSTAENKTPLRTPTFNFAADAQTWTRYALQLEEEGHFQLRHTQIDNAPVGREVHWNSAWAWIIALNGKVRQFRTGESLPLATERANLWLNFYVLFGLVVVLSAWTKRRIGFVAASLVAIGMVGSDRFYDGFIPTYVDHHGLLTAAVFGLILGVLFMGAGWWSTDLNERLLPKSDKLARSAAIISAISGALGLWVSAASVVPPIAIVGIASLLTVLSRGRRALQAGIFFQPAVWRLWGKTGAILSFIFYLVEYAPSHLGFRLEANHPLYALAWWGGGELIAQSAEWWLGLVPRRRVDNQKLAVAIGVILAVPIAIAIGRGKVFIPLDPFVADLHKNISEFLSLSARLKLWGWRQVILGFDASTLSLFGALGLIWRYRRRPSVVLWFCVISSIAFIAMGLWQDRWLLNASGPLICVVLVTIYECNRGDSRYHRWGIGLLFGALLFLPPLYQRLNRFAAMADGLIDPKDALQPLFRDIAAAIRTSQPSGTIHLLSSPNSSTGVGYYGRFETIGTLYWENSEGLKAAAEIFSAHTDDEAARLIKKRGITHIAMISEENFISQYYQLLHPEASADDVKKSFGYRVLGAGQFPSWLQVLPYQVPKELKFLHVTVFLFKVEFNQSNADALYHLAIAQVAWDRTSEAQQTLDKVIQAVPDAPQPWLRKFEIFVDQSSFEDAINAAEKGIALAPPDDRARLAGLAGTSFYEHHAPDLAIRMYRESLSFNFDPAIACDLAWILATARNDKIRNGNEALELAEKALRASPDSAAYLASFAAALAECRRASEAVKIAEFAITKVKDDATLIEKLNQQLDTYKKGIPWRD